MVINPTTVIRLTVADRGTGEPVEVGAQALLGELGQLRIKPGGQHVHGGDLGVVLFAELCGAPHGQACLVGQVGGNQHVTG